MKKIFIKIFFITVMALISFVAAQTVQAQSATYPTTACRPACGKDEICNFKQCLIKSDMGCTNDDQCNGIGWGNICRSGVCYMTKDSLKQLATIQVSCGPSKSKKCTQLNITCKTTNNCKTIAGDYGDTICIKNLCYLDSTALVAYYNSKFYKGDIKVISELKPPTINIRIPGLTFAKINDSISVDDEGNKYINIPWIGQYITSVYSYAMYMVSVVAVVMIIFQGAVVITSGGGDRKVAAYKKIGQVAIGLVIIWSSYLILYNINPDLVKFKALSVRFVESKDAESLELQTTEADTLGPDTAATDIGTYKPAFTSSPITFTAPFKPTDSPEKETRTVEFYNNIGSHITATKLDERILQVADAAAASNVHFGSCGRTVGTIYTLAGVVTKGWPKTCLFAEHGCWTHEHTKVLHTLSRDIIHKLKNYRCGRECNASVENPSGCENSSKAAILKVKQALETAGLKAQGYPDTWANSLKPGDSFWVYNGNKSCSGLHSALFLGWASEGKAIVIDGWYKHPVKRHNICLKTSCGEDIKPLVKIFHPVESK